MTYYRTSNFCDKLMRLPTLIFSAAILTISTSGCGIIYRLPTRQGNIIEQKQLDQLKVGMSREQVKFLMGTPLAASPFRNDRVDYYGYYKTQRGEVSTRQVSLYFDGDKLARMDGVQIASTDVSKAKVLDMPDFSSISKDQSKDKIDASRADSETGKSTGVSIPAPVP